IGPNLAKSTLGQPITLKPPLAAAVDVPAPVANACFTKPRTSSIRMRLLGPLPCTLVRSTPSSRANFRTEGEACGSLFSGRSSTYDSVGEGRCTGAPAGRSVACEALATGTAAACSAEAAGACFDDLSSAVGW